MADKEDDVDPVDKMLKKTGCIDLHYKVQECIAETQDWRKCQNEVKTFRACMEKYTLSLVSAVAGAHFLKRPQYLKKQIDNSVAAARAALNIRDTKMVLVVRTELGMGKGKIAAQCSHAALGCYKIAQKTTPKVLDWWEASGQPKIVLKLDTPGEEGLYKLMQEAKKRGVVSTVIRDAGHTQVERGTATVAGIGPGEVDVLDQITGHLKLL